jgi:DNA invertase Pin-like site-specific DNA recombinase
MISRPHQIADRHLRRRAVVYVRQSSPEQVRANIGSAAVQRDLVQRLAAWGWQSSMIDLLDDDLGITGSRAGARDGFNHLLERMQVGEIGLVAVVDASRLPGTSSTCADSSTWRNAMTCSWLRAIRSSISTTRTRSSLAAS